jgi:NADH:ubiquinone oxidoreductase subunit 6 (subunit J)
LVSEYVPIVISCILLLTVIFALFSKKVSISLISLFYTSVVLGITFTVYGDALVGLLTMVTFAGAISVLLLSVILMTGESKLDIGAGGFTLGLTALTLAVAGSCVYVLASGFATGTGGSLPDISTDVLAFAWQFRPWDLLILVTVFAAAMLAVTNLLSRER